MVMGDDLFMRDLGTVVAGATDPRVQSCIAVLREQVALAPDLVTGVLPAELRNRP